MFSAIAALIGYVAFRGAPGHFIAATTAVAAGATLAVLADITIPEAFDKVRNQAGPITVLGFLTAFVLTKLGG